MASTERLPDHDQRFRTRRIEIEGSQATQNQVSTKRRAHLGRAWLWAGCAWFWSAAIQCLLAQSSLGQPPADPPNQLPPTRPSGSPPITGGRTLEELEDILRASRAELGSRLQQSDNEAKIKPDANPSGPQDPVREGEKRFLELEAMIKERRTQRERELLKLPPLEELPLKSAAETLKAPTAPVQPSDQTSPAVRVAPNTMLPTPGTDAMAMGDALLLADVIASTYRAYPEIEIARLQSGVAQGETTSALGNYDLYLDYFNINQPVANYRNSRSGVALSRQLWWGGYAMAGYRIGRGNFEPWYKERETDQGGEFRTGWIQPLLQGRAIDPYRVQLFQANLSRQAVLPEIQQNILAASLDASYIYWMWVEAGNVLRAQEQLLELAAKRQEGLEKLFERGLSTRQELSINAQTISERQLKVYESRLKFRDAAFKLAIFLRDEAGIPMLAAPEWLPSDFPRIPEVPMLEFDADFAAAQERRPELALINIDLQKLRWDLELARNQMLPNVDFSIQGVQDVGQPASRSDDKGEFQLETGLSGGVPIQRRKARGKIEATLAKIQQTEQKRWLQTNKIEVELRMARNALVIARDMVARSEQLLRETLQTLEYFRREFAAGNRDFLFLLQQEVKATEAEIKLLDAERDYFMALAKLQATLGLDPLEQSLNIPAPPDTVPSDAARAEPLPANAADRPQQPPVAAP